MTIIEVLLLQLNTGVHIDLHRERCDDELGKPLFSSQ